MSVRLLYLVDHPIQYQAPLLRLIAAQTDIDLRVVFWSTAGSNRYFDPGFGRDLVWDTPLLQGYAHQVVAHSRTLTDLIADSDVVWMHGWQGSRMWRALTAARRRGIPVLMRGENTLAAMPDGGGLRGFVKRRYLRWVFNRCTAFLCIGAANREYYLAHDVEPERLFSMPYAVDNEFFRSRAQAASGDRSGFRRSLALEPERPVILYAGKLTPRKNPQVLLEAFRGLDHHRLGRPYLLVVGDGELRQSLEELSRGDDSIRVVGFRNQTELPAFYDLADVFVLASDREPWGLAVNEAMNCKCAAIVSETCGCARDLVDDSCGRIVPAGAVTPLTEALTVLLADREHCRRMGSAATQRIKAWDFERDLAGLREALKGALKERRRA